MTRRLQFRIFECKRCQYKWVPKVGHPILCPNCRSAYWYKERRKKKDIGIADELDKKLGIKGEK